MSSVRITVARKHAGFLSKRIMLGNDGRPKSDGSECRMSSGTAQRVELANGAASGLAEVIRQLTPSEALILGDHVSDNDEIRLTTTAAANLEQGLFGRNKASFHYRPGEPAPALLDNDLKGMPNDVAGRLKNKGGFEGALRPLLKCDYDVLARVVRASTSAGVYHTETGERFPDSGGQHLYLFAKDGNDIPRFLRDLQVRAWFDGFGWILVGKRGQKLIRSIIDVTVGSPERLVFEGKPQIMPPLAQDEEARRPIAFDGELIDTMAACPPLSDVDTRI